MAASLGGARLRIAFLGCGYITEVHSRHVRALRDLVECSYSSRDADRAEAYRRRYDGRTAYGSYAAAIEDPSLDAVVVAVPPVHHRELAEAAIAAGKHVLVEKPAFFRAEDYREVARRRDAAAVTVLVGENDHYKPLAVTLRRLLAEEVIGELLMMSVVTVADRPKGAADWRNDEAIAGGDAFFEEGIHWLHFAGSLGPRIVRVSGHRPTATGVRQSGSAAVVGDRRHRSMVVAFDLDTGAVGTLVYSREVPSLLRGLRTSKLYGREGVITFESNGGAVLVRGRGLPRVVVPGLRDIRGYQAMYRDFVRSIRDSVPPQMSIERALEDHELMEQVRSGR